MHRSRIQEDAPGRNLQRGDELRASIGVNSSLTGAIRSSNHLANLGRREEALAAAQEAAQLRRVLAASRPDAFMPDLAMSLNNLANRLANLGRHDDALVTAQEAAGLYRDLDAAQPDAFTPDLAMSLHTLANPPRQPGPP
jgi:tetratricopeptide (TPR) repeat protein